MPTTYKCKGTFVFIFYLYLFIFHFVIKKDKWKKKIFFLCSLLFTYLSFHKKKTVPLCICVSLLAEEQDGKDWPWGPMKVFEHILVDSVCVFVCVLQIPWAGAVRAAGGDLTFAFLLPRLEQPESDPWRPAGQSQVWSLFPLTPVYLWLLVEPLHTVGGI